MSGRRVNLQKRAQVEQVALRVTWWMLPKEAPRELHWEAMDAAEAAIAPRGGAPELTEEAMVAVARDVVAGICRRSGLEPRAA
jgi:hypothetical protein